jgi:N-acetylglucosamine-6-phosphate deacetylase
VAVGRIHAGGPADLVRLDDVAHLRGVWISGSPVVSADPSHEEVTLG